METGKLLRFTPPGKGGTPVSFIFIQAGVRSNAGVPILLRPTNTIHATHVSPVILLRVGLRVHICLDDV